MECHGDHSSAHPFEPVGRGAACLERKGTLSHGGAGMLYVEQQASRLKLRM